MKLHTLFSEHMVFAAQKPMRVFGESEGAVMVTFNGTSVTAAPENGKFCAELPTMGYGGPFVLTVCGDGETVTLCDVYVGEVYLLAGQSNMQFKMRDGAVTNADCEEVENVRLYSTRRTEDGEKFKPEDGWVPCTAENAPYFSAVGFYVARQVAKTTGCAVGLVTCYQGAAMIQAFMPETVLAKPVYKIADEQRHTDLHFEWNKDAFLYHLLFESIVPFSFSRVLWYQGESNTETAEAAVYADMLTDMITCWRKDLRDQTLPFTVVQIADCAHRLNDAWRTVQAAQAKVAEACPFVTVVKSADISETDDIHPPTKAPLAKRIVENF